MRTLLSFLVLFVVAGCGYFTNPGAMPTGYKYHGEPYNARPGPEVLQIDTATNCQGYCGNECEMTCCNNDTCTKDMTSTTMDQDCGDMCEKSDDGTSSTSCADDTCNKTMEENAPYNLLKH